MSQSRYNTIERLALDTWVFLGFFMAMFMIAHA
jgi:hypothetical protein